MCTVPTIMKKPGFSDLNLIVSGVDDVLLDHYLLKELFVACDRLTEQVDECLKTQKCDDSIYFFTLKIGLIVTLSCCI